MVYGPNYVFHLVLEVAAEFLGVSFIDMTSSLDKFLRRATFQPCSHFARSFVRSRVHKK